MLNGKGVWFYMGDKGLDFKHKEVVNINDRCV